MQGSKEEKEDGRVEGGSHVFSGVSCSVHIQNVILALRIMT